MLKPKQDANVVAPRWAICLASAGVAGRMVKCCLDGVVVVVGGVVSVVPLKKSALLVLVTLVECVEEVLGLDFERNAVHCSGVSCRGLVEVVAVVLEMTLLRMERLEAFDVIDESATVEDEVDSETGVFMIDG